MADTFHFSLYQLSRLAGQNMAGEAPVIRMSMTTLCADLHAYHHNITWLTCLSALRLQAAQYNKHRKSCSRVAQQGIASNIHSVQSMHEPTALKLAIP